MVDNPESIVVESSFNESFINKSTNKSVCSKSLISKASSNNPEKIFEKLNSEIKRVTENDDLSYNSNSISKVSDQNLNEKFFESKYWKNDSSKNSSNNQSKISKGFNYREKYEQIKMKEMKENNERKTNQKYSFNEKVKNTKGKVSTNKPNTTTLVKTSKKSEVKNSLKPKKYREHTANTNNILNNNNFNTHKKIHSQISSNKSKNKNEKRTIITTSGLYNSSKHNNSRNTLEFNHKSINVNLKEKNEKDNENLLENIQQMPSISIENVEQSEIIENNDDMNDDENYYSFTMEEKASEIIQNKNYNKINVVNKYQATFINQIQDKATSKPATIQSENTLTFPENQESLSDQNKENNPDKRTIEKALTFDKTEKCATEPNELLKHENTKNKIINPINVNQTFFPRSYRQYVGSFIFNNNMPSVQKSSFISTNYSSNNKQKLDDDYYALFDSELDEEKLERKETKGSKGSQGSGSFYYQNNDLFQMNQMSQRNILNNVNSINLSSKNDNNSYNNSYNNTSSNVKKQQKSPKNPKEAGSTEANKVRNQHKNRIVYVNLPKTNKSFISLNNDLAYSQYNNNSYVNYPTFMRHKGSFVDSGINQMNNSQPQMYENSRNSDTEMNKTTNYVGKMNMGSYFNNMGRDNLQGNRAVYSSIIRNILTKNITASSQKQPSIFTSMNKGEKKELDLEGIARGTDKSTTVMIRNIPIKYTDELLLEALKEFKGKFNCVYMPFDFTKNGNRGYAFINFIDPLHILYFYEKFNGRTWQFFDSAKICELNSAYFQGINEIQKHAKNYKGPKIPTFFLCNEKCSFIIPNKYLQILKERFPKMEQAEFNENNFKVIKFE